MSHGHSHDGAPCGGHHGDDGAGGSRPSVNDVQALVDQLRLAGVDVSNMPNIPTAPRDMDEARSKSFQFWSTQPVPQMDETVPADVNCAIEENIALDKVRAEPFSLPAGFRWSNVDLSDEEQLNELYNLLTRNYVEDDDSMFRFDYSADFLKWALQVPGFRPEWHCGVRADSNNRLLAFIGAVPQTVRVYDKTVNMVEINFLCVHKNLRSRRVAPVLIREITRRVNVTGIFQAAFTAGIVIPKPVSVCRYYHRSLNPRKLIDVRFSHLSAKMTMARTIKLYKLPEETATRNLREMKSTDVPQVFKLLTTSLKQYSLAPVYNSEEELAHALVPKKGVVYSYVAENQNGKITDFVSFYSLPSTVMGHTTHKTIYAAYLYYYVAGSVTPKQLINDSLILANREKFDVFNALDLMHNEKIFSDLKFGKGDGNLQYYLYNWKCADMKPSQIGLVLQ
ncbi:putative glycylpeptide N-tetradecanoyltransferase [Caenorhabditis elegans]|uniref:Probable glycylpeptide N-tetradecanoyltransferase n=1 Tax=Caenorhabditis elegans TaxID=6239 RepID=NMT_CAEEL|nr:putative glycylpeptide N-tetradecanoyltransferase [Caenorhabditis elegans]P46548.1 RecName: Full=Probable glycylpeptide N-tetradecanoyltransferase; AltName: Full=Myristoyl-CoA:protein N-myristoyltransferase; Short=NMT; AltName: Full=Peptide N-myristoyltransferase [Caenorhabditis elegans]CCD63182.1 Probable glycylpeptide N-tetradecanoyltransferase [Caenorhabditis elegans]|eukprot:NP_498326.1 Probable glycylpeptide N-tetradecanoyltransferase [Caenorhabditis elegans]